MCAVGAASAAADASPVVVIERATLADTRQLAAADSAAFRDDALERAIYGLDDKDFTAQQREEDLEAREVRYLAPLRDPADIVLKAIVVDDPRGCCEGGSDATRGVIVGSAAWEAPESLRDDSAARAREAVQAECYQSDPEWVDAELSERWAAADKKLGRLLGERGRDMWNLTTFGVLPEYQGRGIGLQLLQAGLGVTDGEGQDVYLESTPAAKKFYERNGFQVLGEEEVMDGHAITLMVRKAPARPLTRRLRSSRCVRDMVPL
ncbi:hypothetical protein LTR85_003137 [Meristemomyces frigidus]|nr:hypothetical protein LTR85_003137 [Meristemomyces frigidus]